MRIAIVVALTLALATGCSRKAKDAAPEGAARAFVEELELAREDPKATSRAMQWVDTPSKDALEAHAARAERVQGRRFTADEMIALGHVALAFRPASYVSEGDGDRRIVVVSAAGGSPSERVAVVREGEAWRVALGIEKPSEPNPL